MRIVLSGPDGTGKSTIVEGLRCYFTSSGEVDVSWRRFGFVLARAVNLAGRAMGASYYEQTPLGPIGYHRYRGAFAVVYIVVSFVDCQLFIIPKWWFRSVFSRAKMQIVDRFLIDIVADLILSTENPRAVIKLFDGTLKRHVRRESCIILCCNPKTVINRRPDIAHDKSYIEKVRIYSLLRRMYRIPEIRTDKHAPESCVEKAISICAS